MTRPVRQLPAHIQHSLEQQKKRIAEGQNLTDTAGQPWQGRDFEHSMPADPQDDGTIDPAFERILAGWNTGERDEKDVVASLPGVRLFVAARAEHAPAEEHDGAPASPDPAAAEAHAAGDKAADMTLCSLTAPDGRKALPVFTSADKVTAWAADARPLPFDSRRLALSCVQDGASLLVIDPGEGVNFVVRRPAVWALAKGEDWAPSYESGDVARALREIADEEPWLARVSPARGPRVDAILPGGEQARGGGLGPELECRVFVYRGLTQEQLGALMERVAHAVSASGVLADEADSLTLKILDAGQRPAESLPLNTRP